MTVPDSSVKLEAKISHRAYTYFPHNPNHDFKQTEADALQSKAYNHTKIIPSIQITKFLKIIFSSSMKSKSFYLYQQTMTQTNIIQILKAKYLSAAATAATLSVTRS